MHDPGSIPGGRTNIMETKHTQSRKRLAQYLRVMRIVAKSDGMFDKDAASVIHALYRIERLTLREKFKCDPYKQRVERTPEEQAAETERIRKKYCSG